MQAMQLFWGKVISGQKRGKALGFPTANVLLHKNIADGIYVSLVRIDKTRYHALTFIGRAITFGETQITAESYVLDYSGSLYGRFITIQLLKKLRENKKFANSNELIIQMKKDEKEARLFFATQTQNPN